MSISVPLHTWQTCIADQRNHSTVNVLNILKSPMILLGLVSMAIFIGMPYLVDNSEFFLSQNLPSSQATLILTCYALEQWTRRCARSGRNRKKAVALWPVSWVAAAEARPRRIRFRTSTWRRSWLDPRRTAAAATVPETLPQKREAKSENVITTSLSRRSVHTRFGIGSIRAASPCIKIIHPIQRSKNSYRTTSRKGPRFSYWRAKRARVRSCAREQPVYSRRYRQLVL